MNGTSVGRLVWMLLCAAAGLGGCNTVGPAALASGRGVYNQVIKTTEDEQILEMIVRQRYDETFGLLAVASVTANVRVRANAGAEARAWGSSSDVGGNLVPLSAGVAYEENPTISYVPHAGEQHMFGLMSRLTLDHVLMIWDAAEEKDLWLRQSLASINGMINPRIGGTAPSPAFDRLIDIQWTLIRAHVLAIGRTVASAESPSEHFVSIHDYGDHVEDVRAYLDLLGIEGVAADGKDIYLPVRSSLGRRSTDAIDIETRSVIEVIRSVGTMIEVPAPHLEAGIVEPKTSRGPEEYRFMTVRSSEARPESAVVAIRFRDWWFYIDATDARSKQAFVLLRLLLAINLQDKSSTAPVLTIPAG